MLTASLKEFLSKSCQCIPRKAIFQQENAMWNMFSDPCNDAVIAKFSFLVKVLLSDPENLHQTVSNASIEAAECGSCWV